MGTAAQRSLKKSREHPCCLRAQGLAGGKKPHALPQEGLLSSGNPQTPAVRESCLSHRKKLQNVSVEKAFLKYHIKVRFIGFQRTPHVFGIS